MNEPDEREEISGESLALGAKEIWAVGGGKGGVGKSFVTANIAVGLARKGRQVIVVDADLGGANMHTCLGIAYPPRTLADFVDGRYESLEDIVLNTSVPGLRLISGASDILALANPHWTQKQKIIRHLRRLEASHILLDLGAGTTYNILDFFNIATRKLIVISPEPTSIQNAYGFLKSALFRDLSRRFSSNYLVQDLLKGTLRTSGVRRPETIKQMTEYLQKDMPEVSRLFKDAVDAYRCELIINMSAPRQDKKVYSVVRSVSMGFLGLNLSFLGSIERDEQVARSVDQMSPILLSYPQSDAAAGIRSIVEALCS